jgi:hypothetical protein
MRPEPARKAFARGRRLAKRPPDVQQRCGVFPGLSGGPKYRKSRRNPAALLGFAACERSPRRLEPLGAAPAVIPLAIAVAIATHHAVPEVAAPPAFFAEPA